MRIMYHVLVSDCYQYGNCDR